MTRFKAASTHLSISIVLASIVIGLIIFGWYPLPLFWDIGGPMLIALIVGIDVVLGPAMTLILFNPKKSRRELTNSGLVVDRNRPTGCFNLWPAFRLCRAH
jgi:hypothetical protein